MRWPPGPKGFRCGALIGEASPLMWRSPKKKGRPQKKDTHPSICWGFGTKTRKQGLTQSKGHTHPRGLVCSGRPRWANSQKRQTALHYKNTLQRLRDCAAVPMQRKGQTTAVPPPSQGRQGAGDSTIYLTHCRDTAGPCRHHYWTAHLRDSETQEMQHQKRNPALSDAHNLAT